MFHSGFSTVWKHEVLLKRHETNAPAVGITAASASKPA
jgi:hypothetical protein